MALWGKHDPSFDIGVPERLPPRTCRTRRLRYLAYGLIARKPGGSLLPRGYRINA